MKKFLAFFTTKFNLKFINLKFQFTLINFHDFNLLFPTKCKLKSKPTQLEEIKLNNFIALRLKTITAIYVEGIKNIAEFA